MFLPFPCRLLKVRGKVSVNATQPSAAQRAAARGLGATSSASLTFTLAAAENTCFTSAAPLFIHLAYPFDDKLTESDL